MGGAGHTVQRMVGAHHGFGTRVLDGPLKDRQKIAPDLAFADRYGRAVQAAGRDRVHREVLGLGDDAGHIGQGFALQAFHDAVGQLAGQMGVFAKGLFGSAPARIPGDLKNRGKGQMNAPGPHLGGNHRTCLANQVAVKRRGHGDHLRQDRVAGSAGAVQAFLGDQDGYAQARIFAAVALDLVREGSVVGNKVVDTADPLRSDNRAQFFRIRPRLVCAAPRDRVAIRHQIGTVNHVGLPDFFPDRHASEQI